jgi:hypothetical protein
VNVDTVGRGGWRPDEIIGQIYVTRGRPGADRHVHFRMGSLMADGAYDRTGAVDSLPSPRRDAIRMAQGRVQARRDSMTARLARETYARPALAPAMPWLDGVSPAAPSVERRVSDNGVAIGVSPGRGEASFLWVVQSRWPVGWRTELVPAMTREFLVGSTLGLVGSPDVIWVSAVDRTGNQSTLVRLPPLAR